jgi:osmoprotectant transport system substrate-binding protein
VIAGCGGRGQPEGAPSAPRAAGVVVASFNFPESELLAELAAQILAAHGVPVRRELDLGPREVVLPTLQQGLVDVVPEYVGSATAALVPRTSSDPRDAHAMRAALARALAPWHAEPLALAPAANVNGVVVTRETARRFRLKSISDLASIAPSLTIGGPPECPTRPYCLAGLHDVYGLNFKGFVPLAGETLVRRALQDRVVDVGIMFTTDGDLAQREFVLLDDDRRLQPADNIVPIVRDDAVSRYGAGVAEALDAVSTRLTTPMLRFLNWRVTVEGNSPAAEARGWLVRQGLVTLDGRAATAAS